ncbi:hypothetical protein [Olsenella massiliensis]|uniref:hypothetical protein n=1 Tax=Olsenella massiliensis TaxID=1622075 RepID=UPI00071D0878|nr:hypothetical protein [Olsenella massiliensis]
MAANDRRPDPDMRRRTPQRGRANVKGELILTAIMFAGVFAITLVLRFVLHLNSVYAPIFTAVIAAVIVFYAYRHTQRQRWERENADAQKTVNPIIERYAASRSPRQLMRDYAAWAKDAHDPDLQLQFLQLIVETLIKDGHPAEARTMLGRMEAFARESGNDKNFAGYKADVEGRLR